jgi:hypothetical protein
MSQIFDTAFWISAMHRATNVCTLFLSGAADKK